MQLRRSGLACAGFGPSHRVASPTGLGPRVQAARSDVGTRGDREADSAAPPRRPDRPRSPEQALDPSPLAETAGPLAGPASRPRRTRARSAQPEAARAANVRA